MVLFVNKDALGVKMTGPAQVSLVLGAAQVSLWLLVTFPSSFLPDTWRFASNSLLDLSFLSVIMNFIHKTLFFSGYNNVSCVLWVCN